MFFSHSKSKATSAKKKSASRKTNQLKLQKVNDDERELCFLW
jgi:hypothetical protein